MSEIAPQKERRKVTQLLAIEAEVQKIWEEQKPFEVDAPDNQR
jgi:leucyl-tRNA synthetase